MTLIALSTHSKGTNMFKKLKRMLRRNPIKEERSTGFAGSALGVASHGLIEMLVMREMRRQFDLDGSICPCCCCRRRKDNDAK